MKKVSLAFLTGLLSFTSIANTVVCSGDAKIDGWKNGGYPVSAPTITLDNAVIRLGETVEVRSGGDSYEVRMKYSVEELADRCLVLRASSTLFHHQLGYATPGHEGETVFGDGCIPARDNKVDFYAGDWYKTDYGTFEAKGVKGAEYTDQVLFIKSRRYFGLGLVNLSCQIIE